MHRCKREAVDLEKMQSLEEQLEEEEKMLKKKNILTSGTDMVRLKTRILKAAL